MPILCEPATSSGRLLYTIGGDVRAVDSLTEAARMLDRDPTEFLVVIGPRAPTNEALAFAASLRMSRPAVGVVLTRHEVDVALLTSALQSGVREVVRVGDDAALAAACRRSYEVSRRMVTEAPVVQETGGHGQIVTVFAAKGGCGKTTLATNLGVVLAEGTGLRVCIVDLDLAFGDVAISMQLDPARTVVDALPMAGHLDTTGAASLLTRYRPGLEVLLAPVTPGDAEKITPALVGELLTVLRTIFDYVVVDTPAQFSEHVLIAMDSSDHHVLLTTPDVPALKNLRVTLDMLSYPRQIRSIVVNRSDSKVGLSLEQVEQVVRCPISARVPSSRAVPISINKGTPITLDSPAHPVSHAIARFAQQRLLPAAAPAGQVEQAAPRRGRRSA
jgi:Flp pilus assembly CpaE family ATPase